VSTAIVTKYSTANTVPTANSLLGGELAYSFPSGNLFIGTEAGSYEIIGGSYYTNIIDQVILELVFLYQHKMILLDLLEI